MMADFARTWTTTAIAAASGVLKWRAGREYTNLRSPLVVALGPPGEYDEESIRVPIDQGQSFFLPRWMLVCEARDGDA